MDSLAPADRLLDAIRRARAAQDGPLIVAVDGHSGTGKSTLAHEVAARLDAALIEGDDFYAGGVEVRDADDAELAESCIDWRQQREVLQALKTGEVARYHAFDWAAFDGSQAREATVVEPKPVILLEGVYSARRALADLVDLAVLITTDHEARLLRLEAREGTISPWERQWHRAEDWYFAHDATADRFDLTLAT